MLKLTRTIINALKTNNKAAQGMIKCNNKRLKTTVVEVNETQANVFDNAADETKGTPQTFVKTRNSMVAAAFAALQPNTKRIIKTPFTDNKIDKAKSVDELLSISEGNGVSRRHALKVVSTLADWSSSGRITLADFENDSRFIKLCRILTKGTKLNKNFVPRNEDLSTVINIAADDEAARLVAGLTPSQAVKVMTSLSQKKRRSILLLRSLTHNITSNLERLNLKQSADVLYSMSVLNYHDDNLLAKICEDIKLELGKTLKTSSVIGSIVTSLGLLKYKNSDVLDGLSEWFIKNQSILRTQDIFSLFITLATLNHTPATSQQLYKTLVPQLSEAESRKPLEWLNLVWSLVLLNQASPTLISSVLNENFVNKFEENTSAKLKLLNINGAAVHLLKDYQGPTLSPVSTIYKVKLGKSKEKIEIIDAVMDTLKNLIQLKDHLNTNINTNLGFSIDAYCLLDMKCNALPINKDNEARSDVRRVGILVFDYHDMCHGHGKFEPTGLNVFACKLLKCQNYKIITIPYNEFKLSDKLVHRVQYLESKLKEIIK